MVSLKRFKAAAAAALIASSALTSGCSSLYDKDSVTLPSSEATAAATSSEEEMNVPAFLDSDAVTQPPASTTEPDVTENHQPDSPATQPQVPEPLTTDSQGMIVDDWREGLDLGGGEDAASFYERFRIDRSAREGYYRMISSECRFPIVHISTENKQEIVSLDDYVNCVVDVFNCDDIYKITASGGIRVRGNASANYGNVDWIRNNIVSYRIKFDEKQQMLGLNDFARCRSWILLKAYDTAVRNLLAFRLGTAINEGNYYVSDSTPVQVYINEKYAGFYILCEQTQENSERVDINEAEDGYTGTDIGYLVELDNYATSDDDPYFYLIYNKEPITDVYGTERVPRKYAYSVKNDLYGDEQLKFIERQFEIYWEIAMRAIKYGEFNKIDENCEIVPAQEEFSSAYDCINAAIDVESVVDMYILYELVNDQDLGGGSFFFAVDYGAEPTYERLTMVAPWDFDWGYSDYNCTPDGGLYAARFKDDYFVENWGDRSNPWLILFYSADWFQELVRQKWAERKAAILSTCDEVENLAVEYSEDFNKDGVKRASRAVTTVNWVRDRVDYLSTLWG